MIVHTLVPCSFLGLTGTLLGLFLALSDLLCPKYAFNRWKSTFLLPRFRVLFFGNLKSELYRTTLFRGTNYRHADFSTSKPRGLEVAKVSHEPKYI
jgi:hypothetical protein